jgi:FixJ family two-component response regulator
VIRQRIASLTPREHQVLELLVTGLLNKQVGALGTAVAYVWQHRDRHVIFAT